MTIRNTKKRLAGLLIGGAALLLGASPIRANTYLYSFSASDVINALNTAAPAEIHHNQPFFVAPNDGVFAIFLQPIVGPGVTYTEVKTGEVGPNPDRPDSWIADANISDPSDTNLRNGNWYQFSKAPGQSSVALISVANGSPTGNIFMFKDPANYPDGCYNTGCVYGDTGFQVDSFGPLATITSIIPADARFRFQLQTNGSGALAFSGFASVVHSDFDDELSQYPGDAKTNEGIAFTLNLTGISYVPEPGSVRLFGAGAAVLGLGVLRSKRRRRSPAA